jgi:hypothetical protein
MRYKKLPFRFLPRRGLAYSLGLSMAILLLGGFCLLEPKVETLSDGLYSSLAG